MRPRIRLAVVVAAALAAVAIGGCATTGAGEPTTAGGPIVLGGPPAATTPADDAGVDDDVLDSVQPSPSLVVDDGADLDIDDQSGDGTTVRVESARTSLAAARIVIVDADGRILGSDRITPGVQVVTIALDVPVAASGELLAMLVIDNGDDAVDLAGVVPIVDDEGEPVEEDFDFALR